MAVIKHPYELSVWTESLNDGIKTEKKGVIIGAHDMSYLGKATQIKFKKELKGTHTLTFQMPSKFFDSEKGEYIHNELCDAILTESKIKLFYKDKYYDFTVKKIDEKKVLKAIMYTYSCQDSFIDELSRIGYDIQFAPELNNSVAEMGEFMEKILDGSSWIYAPEYNYGDFTEYNEQRFYKIPLSLFGGAISAYPINLEVRLQDFLNEDGTPKPYLLNFISVIEWHRLTEFEQYAFIKNLTTIYGDKTERPMQIGDDLARVREIFWDPYYTDNGSALISESNKVSLTGDCIYVPLTDLSYIMGSVYEDAYTAVEEPAIYGSYKNNSDKYALQPTSKNPKDLIQFVHLGAGGEYSIDEANVLSMNANHYVIPIDEWQAALEKQLKSKTDLIFWSAPVDKSGEMEYTNKYDVETDEDTAYTSNVSINSSTIDDFTWYPVYSEGYLSEIDGKKISKARKLSVTNRTEYNKAADIYTTVYNNKATEFIDGDVSLYSEEELTERLDTEDYRVCSKLNTRQILPTLARNLLENATKITDVNAWESRIQNRNHDKTANTGSMAELMKIVAQSTITKADTDKEETIEDYEVDGTINDESVSDFYLEITSPYRNKCLDFSLEGTREYDYAVNFGMIAQERQIEKDKVYAIKIKTGNMKTVGLQFTYRNDSKIDKIESNIEQAQAAYEKTLRDYKTYIDYFSKNTQPTGTKIPNELETFYEMIKRWPVAEDSAAKEKYGLVDDILTKIIFGGEVRLWLKDNKIVNGEQSMQLESPPRKLQGIVNIHDAGVTETYKKFKSIAVKGVEDKNNTGTYRDSDIKYLKFYLYRLLSIDTGTTQYALSTSQQLTNSIVQSWIKQYITFDKRFETVINKDLDKIVIGQGSIDLDGNYTIQGTTDINGKTNKEDKEYISFKDVFKIQNIAFIPSREKQSDITNALTEKKYHTKKNKKWAWSNNTSETDVTVPDEAYLLFKANQTIKNPYVAVKVESGPLKIIFNSISETTYAAQNNKGIRFSAVKKESSNIPTFLNDVGIKLIPVNRQTCSEEFLNLIKFNSETGNYDPSWRRFVPEWKESYLKNSYNSQDGVTNAASTLTFNTFIKTPEKEQSYPYLVFVNNELKGIMRLAKSGGN